MIVYETSTNLSREGVLTKAKEFIGPDGKGLNLSAEDECCLTFEGVGGFITVTVNEEDPGDRKVEVTSREWDSLARDFLRKV